MPTKYWLLLPARCSVRVKMPLRTMTALSRKSARQPEPLAGHHADQEGIAQGQEDADQVEDATVVPLGDIEKKGRYECQG